MTKFGHVLEGQRLVLKGVLDEDSDLERIAGDLDGPTIRVDLSAVDRVTRGGVREWVTFLNAAAERDIEVIISKCSGAMATQLGRRGKSECAIESLAVPYFCSGCDAQRIEWVDVASFGGPPFAAPAGRCSECDLAMAFDDDPSYFAVLGETVRSSAERSAASPPVLSPSPTRAGNGPLIFAIIVAVVIAVVVLLTIT